MSSTEWETIKSNIGMAINDIATLVVLMDQTYNTNDQYRNNLIEDLHARYEKGKETHTKDGTTWDEWKPEDFVLNISEEILDCIIYGAAFIDKYAETVTVPDASSENEKDNDE